MFAILNKNVIFYLLSFFYLIGLDSSYSSYDSFDSNDHRRRHRKKNRHDRGSRRNHRSGTSSKREKRRRDDSDDEGLGNDSKAWSNNGSKLNTAMFSQQFTGGGMNHMNSNNMGNQNHNRNNNHHNNQPRKPELCKFYLMECCAKGEKCLYMHGDFPCKFYYLGMKGHNREMCKFSHGKPLTDQLRALLLKHLETAPKEILGDFPRLPRETAIGMLNATHQKLLVKFGMEPDPGAANASGQSSKLPSLLDLSFGKFPSTNEMGAMNSGNAKNKDKPRKSRWTEQRSGESESMPPPTSTNSSKRGHQTSTTTAAKDNDIKLSSLGDFTPEQVEKLAKMGIETVNQITQLTVLQIIDLGLSIALISELQLKAAQLQQSKQQQQQQQAATKPQDSPAEPDTPFSPRADESERYVTLIKIVFFCEQMFITSI